MNKLFLIAGPCVVENETTPLEIGEKVKSICDKLGIDYIFKASYKKANRTKMDSFMGIGDQKALEIIYSIGKKLNVPTITDIHESTDAAIAAQYVDYLQIPAFLCRQTELLVAAAKTGKGINVKKGQFVSPEAMKFPVEKIQSSGNSKIWVCERGFTFGYENLVVDATVITRLKKLGVPVVMDCTHSLQITNRAEGISGGNPELIETIARFAVATGADGLFIETHPKPAEALSDGQSMLPLEKLEAILTRVMKIKTAIND